jgi:hypothetical protein
MATDHTDRVVPKRTRGAVGRPKKPKSPKKAITIRITVELLGRMDVHHAETGVSKTFMVERGVSSYLSKLGKPQDNTSALLELEEAARAAAEERMAGDG